MVGPTDKIQLKKNIKKPKGKGGQATRSYQKTKFL